MSATITSASPFYPVVLVLLAMSGLGILTVLLSKNVRLKRVVLPVTLVLFSIAAFGVVLGSGSLTGQPITLIAVAAVLVLNALWVSYIFKFCAVCGRTMPRSGTPPWTCPACRQTQASSPPSRAATP
jgi:hypothetical protein